MNQPDASAIHAFLTERQDEIVSAVEARDTSGRFERQTLEGERGGLARPAVFGGGDVFDRVAVNFSHTRGADMPAAASQARPHLAGASYEAISVSVIVHPTNPYAPTSHANFRYFQAKPQKGDPVWWFGGGFDLTPYYGFEEDAVGWHRHAKAACDTLGPQAYARYKAWCDEYFYLPHREETRGVGGIFFDDLNQPDAAACEAFWRAAAQTFVPAYFEILDRRRDTTYGPRELDFQRYRRGRYVEFNLLYDRGTRFGLQAGGRTESILASMPPIAHWQYDYQPEPGSPEAELARGFLQPRDWLGIADPTLEH